MMRLSLLGEQGSVRSAVEKVYRRKRHKLFAFAYAMLGDSHSAEDALHDAFTKVLESSPTCKEQIEMYNYIMRILYTTSVDRLRRKRELPFDTENYPGSVTDCSCERNTAVLNAVHSLPDEQRDVVLLRHYSGLSFKEISELLGVPLGTVLSRMRYGLLKLKSLLERRV